MKQRTFDIGSELFAILVAISLLARTSPARALSLQDIITRSESAVVHVEVIDARGAVVGTGSGFTVSRDGRVVTNHHVVERAERVQVQFPDGKKVEARGVIAFDEAVDLAVLQLEKGSYPDLPLSATPVKQGDPVVVIGSPMGLSGSVSTGIVSALRPQGAHLGPEHRMNWSLQLTAAISPGSSGSPVMNESGEVVAVAVGHVDGEALNFGVAVASLERLLSRASKQPLPLRVLRGDRSPLMNLLISAGGIGGFGLVLWVTAWVLERKRRRGQNKSSNVVELILKR